MQTFTQAVVAECLRDAAEIAEAAQEWSAEYPLDRDRAEVEFATQLQKDFAAWHVDAWDSKDPESRFPHAVYKLAFMHVNWRRVAAFLLDRFVPRPEWRFNGRLMRHTEN